MPLVRLIFAKDGKQAVIDLETGRHIYGTQHWNESEIAESIRPYLEKYLAAYPAKRKASIGSEEHNDASSLS